MKPSDGDIIVYLRKRSAFYGLRAKQRSGKLADRDRAIARAYRDDASVLERPALLSEVESGLRNGPLTVRSD